MPTPNERDTRLAEIIGLDPENGPISLAIFREEITREIDAEWTKGNRDQWNKILESCKARVLTEAA
jgi:hypothetical protein